MSITNGEHFTWLKHVQNIRNELSLSYMYLEHTNLC